MCLPFYSMPIEPPNDKSRALVAKLRILFYCQLVLAIIKCFFLFSSMSSGDSYMDIFSCCAIYLAYSQINHMGCVIHLFLSLYSLIMEFVVIGTLVQNGISLFSQSSTMNFYMVMVFISVIFYIIAMYYVFQAYKEFKALSIEGLLQQPGGLGGGYYGQEDDQDYYPQDYYYPQQQENRQQSQPPANQNQNQSSNARRNENIQMSNTSNNNANNSSNQNRTNNNPTTGGGFKAFSGSGVKIGGS